jgi:proteasome lid subunit RPN8/RPN11
MPEDPVAARAKDEPAGAEVDARPLPAAGGRAAAPAAPVPGALSPAIAPPSPAPAAPAPPVDEDFRVLAMQAIAPRALALGPAFADLRGFAVFISRAAATNIMRHGEKGLQTEYEVAGGLVGYPAADPGTGLLFTRITAALAVHGYADQYEVEIPPEEWFRLSNQVRDEEVAGAAMALVGWYHSHPIYEAYLSAVDQETQRQFFGEVWNVAIVVAPQRRQIKAFHGGGSRPCELYLDPEETGGELVPVTYEVSAGAVSTTAGVEWFDPDEPYAAEPAAPPAAPDPPFAPVALVAPAALPGDGYPPPAPQRSAGLLPPGVPTLVVALVALAIFLLLVLIALTLFNMFGVRVGPR